MENIKPDRNKNTIKSPIPRGLGSRKDSIKSGKGCFNPGLYKVNSKTIRNLAN